MKRINIKDFFICNMCRQKCGACIEDLERLKKGIVDDKNKDLVGRKQEIVCLGRYCPTPCEFQDVECYKDIDITKLLELIEFLGNKCNDLIATTRDLEKECERLHKEREK